MPLAFLEILDLRARRSRWYSIDAFFLGRQAHSTHTQNTGTRSLSRNSRNWELLVPQASRGRSRQRWRRMRRAWRCSPARRWRRRRRAAVRSWRRRSGGSSKWTTVSTRCAERMRATGGGARCGALAHAGAPCARVQDVAADDSCAITIVFGQLMAIKQDANCQTGCAGGRCPPDWYPSGADTCSAECGLVFEPFCKPAGPSSAYTHATRP
jgi:hypothetical protein